jgi:hypothetical protein
MVSADDLDGIRELLAVFVGAGLDARAPRDAAELELLALDGIGPFGNPELPDEVLALFPAALASRRDELAAGLLAALAELAPSRLATFAAEERDRLARDGIGSALAEGVGRLQVRECYRLTLGGGEAEILGVLLDRPGDRKVQPAGVILEHEACGGVVVDGILGEPDTPASARRLLAEPDPGAVANPIDADEFADALGAALEHMVEHNLELPVDVLPPLLALRRALGRNWPMPRLCADEDLPEQEAGEHADPFATAHAGPANALVMQMRAEGVDLTDEDSVARWIADFNARPFEHRDRVLGPSLLRPAPRAVHRRKAHRRSAKAARKRNRR